MQAKSQPDGRGGRREGAGRKKTTEKRIMFGASADVVEILKNLECSKSDFINAAIRAYAVSQGL